MPRFTLDLTKAMPVQDEHGQLTKRGHEIAHNYAKQWLDKHERNLVLEREHPDLQGLFYDCRIDPELAKRHAHEKG